MHDRAAPSAKLPYPPKYNPCTTSPWKRFATPPPPPIGKKQIMMGARSAPGRVSENSRLKGSYSTIVYRYCSKDTRNDMRASWAQGRKKWIVNQQNISNPCLAFVPGVENAKGPARLTYLGSHSRNSTPDLPYPRFRTNTCQMENDAILIQRRSYAEYPVTYAV